MRDAAHTRRAMTLSDIENSLEETGKRLAEYGNVTARLNLGPEEIAELANWAFRLADGVRNVRRSIAGELQPSPDNVIPLRNAKPAALPSPVDAEGAS